MLKFTIAGLSLVLCSCATTANKPASTEAAEHVPTRGIASLSAPSAAPTALPACSYVLFEKQPDGSKSPIVTNRLALAQDPVFPERLSGRALLPQVEGVVEASRGIHEDEFRYEFLGVRGKAIGLMEEMPLAKTKGEDSNARGILIPLGRYELALRCGD